MLNFKICIEYYLKNVGDCAQLDSLLEFLAECPNSEWALKKAAVLEINLGKLDQAVERIQKLVRAKANALNAQCEGDEKNSIKTEMCALWSFLSEAYKQKGNLQSAIRACNSVLAIQPENYTARLQVNLLRKLIKEKSTF